MRACVDWLVGTDAVSSESAIAHEAMPGRIAHFAIERKIGEGGMGVVYAALDERLNRPIALKMMSRARDETARARFWREARAAAAINHPNVCQIYEIGEDRDEMFIAMELLEGDPLDQRLRRGAMDVSQVVTVALEMLSALAALHARGIVHRDLKPSNVFLSPSGVKLLDFGLAQLHVDGASSEDARLTRTGFVLGTPHYLAPERISSGLADERSDLFAVGAILFEMVCGRPAFDGHSMADILHAVVYEQPPPLQGSPGIHALDRLIRRALAKRPTDRPASAGEMSAELSRIQGVSVGRASAVAHPFTRVVVLPFQVPRVDSDLDFLAFSLPDAIATSLSVFGSLTVRSSVIAARFTDPTDLKTIAAEADVDRVIAGRLFASGAEMRVSVQLVEAPSGTLLASQTIPFARQDLFGLQDNLVRRLIAALAVPLVDSPPQAVDRPRDPQAYEWYLRAKDLARRQDSIVRARSFFERCVERDPGFAPAWAHLGRCHHVIGKFIDSTGEGPSRAEAAYNRALELNPELSVAHKHLAHLEADRGLASRAVARLLEQVRRHGNDPELFAGLVHACRYCGLNDASLAAHAEARRLDPNIPTSVEETLILTGNVERLLTLERSLLPTGTEDANRVIGLGLAGRRHEARAALEDMRRVSNIAIFEAWTRYLSAWLDRRPAEMVFDVSALGQLGVHEDPEAIFQEGWLLCDAGDHERGLERIGHAITKGYFAAETLSSSSHFGPVCKSARFQSLLSTAQRGRERALRVFQNAGGDHVLGIWNHATVEKPPETRHEGTVC